MVMSIIVLYILFVYSLLLLHEVRLHESYFIFSLDSKFHEACNYEVWG